MPSLPHHIIILQQEKNHHLTRTVSWCHHKTKLKLVLMSGCIGRGKLYLTSRILAKVRLSVHSIYSSVELYRQQCGFIDKQTTDKGVANSAKRGVHKVRWNSFESDWNGTCKEANIRKISHEMTKQTGQASDVLQHHVDADIVPFSSSSLTAMHRDHVVDVRCYHGNEQFTSFHRYLKYCHTFVTIVFSIPSAIIWA